jgi:hypothetical protein
MFSELNFAPSLPGRRFWQSAPAYRCGRFSFRTGFKQEQSRRVGLSYLNSQYSQRDPPMNTLPVDRALAIYETLADRSAIIRGTRERLSKHLMKIYLEGEKDPHRLMVHGLSYLRDLDRDN